MTSDAAWNASQTREVTEYLKGMERILRRLHSEKLGKETEDTLVSELQAIGLAWEPLRYQVGVGQGFDYVADNVRDLVRRVQ